MPQDICTRFVNDLVTQAELLEPINYTRRFLVIDDNVHVREIFKEVISSEGCAAELATNPDEAVDAVAKTIQFERVFLDLHFPGFNETGIKVFKKLRALMPELPITVISGYTNDEFERLAKQYGYDFTILPKPINIQDIRKIINQQPTTNQ